MAQYEVTAPKDRNASVRAGGTAYVFLAGTKRVVDCSGAVAGKLEANGLKLRHVGDEPTVEATFHAEKVAEARAAGPEDLNDYAPVEEKVGAPEKATDEEEGDPTTTDADGDLPYEDELAHFQALVTANGIKTKASTVAGMKQALAKGGVDWRNTPEDGESEEE